MSEERYVNYHQKSEMTLDILRKEGRHPSLLMHVCCGPCSCFPLTYLCRDFDVTLYYGHSNIYPEEEFLRRRKELETLLVDIKRDYGFDVKLVMPPYEHETYMEDLHQFASEKEGGKRCLLCYKKRMKEAYDYAEKQGFDYFCTVMTISRQKNSQILNRLGKELEAEHAHTRYFYSDFKKKGGIDKGREMRIHYGLYNQLYCGCEYSLDAAKDRLAQSDQDHDANPGD